MKRVRFEIDPNDKGTGVKTISLVDEPALESDFVAFSKNKPQYVELKIEGYKQIVAGLALIPDKDIIRMSGGEKYLAYFTKESIEKIRNKFHKEQMTSNVNVDHSQDDYINAYLIESFIVDSPERLADVTAKGIKDAVLGSWFVAYKIEDEKVFNEVLDGKLKGFSVEIFVNKISMATEGSLKAGDKVIMKPGKSYMEEIIFTVVDQVKGPVVLIRAGQSMSLQLCMESDLQKVEVTSMSKEGKQKGIFERKLKMIESEINNN